MMSANACVRSFGTASDASTCVRGTIKNDIAAETELARMIRRYKRLLIAFATVTKQQTKIPLSRKKQPNNAPNGNLPFTKVGAVITMRIRASRHATSMVCAAFAKTTVFVTLFFSRS